LGTIDYYKFYFLNLWGFTPMAAFTAIWQLRDVNAVKSLLDRGVSPNAKDASGSTLIHYAVTNNQVDIARLLIDRGADIHARYGQDGHTVLHLAVLHQDGHMTNLLLSSKADPNARDNFKLTPLHIAMLRHRTPYQPSIGSYYGLGDVGRYGLESSLKPIQYLLSNGADVNAISDREVPPEVAFFSRKFGTPLNLIPNNQTSRDADTIMLLVNAGGKKLECDPVGEQCELSDSRERMVRTYSCKDKKCIVISRQKLRSANEVKQRRFK
jgi:Ankyrin repeats (3 copies)/Ankyrin repeat